MKLIKQQSGVGLIEVLIASVVFAVGITAVVQLQGTFFKSSSDANARSIAMSIAQEKIEDLRGFQVTDSTVQDIFDFTSIATNQGGRCTEQIINGICTLVLPAGVVSRGNISFNRAWTVNNFYYNAGTLTTTPNADIVQKQITVTVTWTDVDGTSQAATLNTVINKFSGAASTGLLANYIGGSGAKPVVIHSPSQDTGVVSVPLSASVNRETLVPTTNSAGQLNFTAYTYGVGGALLRQEEFLTVSCNCAYKSPGSSGLGLTAAHATWDTANSTYKDQDGDLVIKDVGWVTNGRNANAAGNPDPLCTSCCGDHHDPDTTVTDSTGSKYCDPVNGILDRCFDPFRGSADFSSGKHKHYTVSGVLATSGEYLESCRMKRVNGYWRVYQDWHRTDLNVFPLDYLVHTTGTTSNTEADYATYTQGVVNSLLSTTTSPFNGQVGVFSLPKPNTVAITEPLLVDVSTRLSLTARAIYIDYLSSTILTEIRKKSVSDRLVDVPFYEIEVTQRGSNCAGNSPTYGGWCPPSNASVDVGAGAITNSRGNDLAPGQIKGVSSTNSSNVSFSMRRSNSGLMGLSDPVDINSGAVNHDDILDDALVPVKVVGAGSTTHSLTITLSGGTPISGVLSDSNSSDSNSSVCTGSDNSYTCNTVLNSVAGTLSFNGTDFNRYICTGSSSYVASSSNQPVTLPINCVPVNTTHNLSVSFTGTGTGGNPSTGTLTSNLATCPTTNGNTPITCTESNTASGTSTWGFLGSTSSGSSCSGTGDYTVSAGTVARSVILAVTCIPTRNLTLCLTVNGNPTIPPEIQPFLSDSTSSGMSCTTGINKTSASPCTQNNQGLISSCRVTTSGSGYFTVNNTLCTASKTWTLNASVSPIYNSTDSFITIPLLCN